MTTSTRSLIAGALELVIAAWAILRFTQARAVAGATADATEVATSTGGLVALSWQLLLIAAPIGVGLWLIFRGPTRVINVMMVVSLAVAVGMFAFDLPAALGSLPALASGLAYVALAFVCWKLVHDDLQLLGAAVVAGAVAGAVAVFDALAGEHDLGIGGWVTADGTQLQVVASPAPERGRLLARDELGGWCELPSLDPETGCATVDLPAGRWYLALQAPAPLEASTQLRVLRMDVPVGAPVTAAPALAA